MKPTEAHIRQWMEHPEGCTLEFKEGRTSYDFEKLASYCVAICNERGGYFVLGITDQRPRTIVGSKAFLNLHKIENLIFDRLRFRIKAYEVLTAEGRVLAFEIPSRPSGVPVPDRGTYWMRAGESLAPMSQDQLRAIFAEDAEDYSSKICTGSSIGDIDPSAAEVLKELWAKKSQRGDISSFTIERLLSDLELAKSSGLTFAAIALLGSEKAVATYLPQAELIWEFRTNELKTDYQQRREFRRGFFGYQSEIWDLINSRNEIQRIQDGFFVRDIPTFNAIVIREAILNAVSHRDYSLQGSIFVRQSPNGLEVESPGGFPTGITVQNILWKQLPRNRRIAEVFSKCGLVERSGQGINRIYENLIREGKAKPDFSKTDSFQVNVRISGQIKDPKFLQFLEMANKEDPAPFSIEDLLLLNHVASSERIPEELRDRIPALEHRRIIEKVGKGRGTKFILSGRFYGFLGEPGTYTRKKGLSDLYLKELLVNHLKGVRDKGCKLAELKQVVPDQTRPQLQRLLKALKLDGRAECKGRTNAALWFYMHGPKQ